MDLTTGLEQHIVNFLSAQWTVLGVMAWPQPAPLQVDLRPILHSVSMDCVLVDLATDPKHDQVGLHWGNALTKDPHMLAVTGGQALPPLPQLRPHWLGELPRPLGTVPVGSDTESEHLALVPDSDDDDLADRAHIEGSEEDPAVMVDQELGELVALLEQRVGAQENAHTDACLPGEAGSGTRGHNESAQHRPSGREG